MDTAKVIRTIGYIVYTILWTPFIVLFIVSMPIWAAIMCIRLGIPAANMYVWFVQSLKYGIAHDANFIKTGEW